MKNARGQALIESILILPVLVVVISAVFWFARVVIARQQLLMAARYGTDMIAYTRLDEEQIKEEITNYLCDRDIEGRKLDPVKLNINIVKKEFPEIDLDIKEVLYRPDKLGRMLYGILNPLEDTSYVEVGYEFDIPGIFSAWSPYIGGEGFAGNMQISARSEVLAGTGSKR